MTGYGNQTPVLKKSMEKELTDRLHSIAFRATKAECLDLPETTDIIRKIDLEPSAMKVYKDLVHDSFAELGKAEVTVTEVDNNRYLLYETIEGNPTKDKIFILSVDEAERYFTKSEERIGRNTPYALAQGAYDEGGSGIWWLRTRGGNDTDAACVTSGGEVTRLGADVSSNGGAVRPAFWINLES